ncbi:cytochrome P450 1A2 [Phlyctema vagabunda]|uniref:Cytochrome P450 1A2 n=1 Tax=Phlyctema vagabunda TaxID=108571 RepID=A0ABR4P295_9HELO
MEEQGWTGSLTLLRMGQQWRKNRRLFHNAFTPANCVPYRASQQREARKLVGSIIQTPKRWEAHLVTFATTIILNITYGINIESEDDPWVKLAERSSDALSNGGAAGATFVDFFPAVRRLPRWVNFIPSLTYARAQLPTIQQLHNEPYDLVKREMNEGVAKPSFIEKMLTEVGNRGDAKADEVDSYTERDLRSAGATMFVAGSDTTWSTISVFVLNMVLNPEVQIRAQEEIDSVVGSDRLPTFADRANLPFVDYVVQETFRWHPVLPVGVPHKVSEDDYYKGYFIPKGTMVMANASAIHHDPNVYKSPETFDPTRYVPVSQGGRGEPFPIAHFGFGRRICPGQHLGAASVWMVIVTMLATLRFAKAKDEQGQEIVPNGEMSTGFTSHPKSFICDIQPRSEKIASLVAEG